MQKELLSLTERLIRFPTIAANPRALRECADFIWRYFENLPVKQQVILHQRVPTVVITTRRTKSPKILLHGHFDVVDIGGDHGFFAKRKGNLLYGRGSVDMKGGIAVMMHAARKLIEENPSIDLGLMFHGDEEVGSKNGAEYVVKKLGYSTKLLINFDGGLNETISHAEKGILRLRLVSEVKKTHPVHNPWKGDNAIDELVRAYEKFQELFPGKNKATEKNNWYTTYTVWNVDSANQVSYSSHRAEMFLSMHFVEEWTVPQFLEYIRRRIPEIKIELMLGVERVFVPKNNPSIKLWQKIMREEFQKPIPIRAENGSSDARFFSRFQIPMIITTINGSGTHTGEECLEISSLVPMHNTLYRFLKASWKEDIPKVRMID